MAPQQNSTLIDDTLEACPSLFNLPEALKSSPILPPKCQRQSAQKQLQQQPQKPHNNHDNNVNNNYNNYNNMNNNNNNNNHYKTTDNQNDCHRRHKNYKSNRTGSSRGGRSHRSISLYGVNSTVEQGHKEIPIWIDDEPRYVSGVTNKTTCNDIIKALIDDEIRDGNYAYCKHTKDGAASRDYSDYVLTESWRGIERSYDGNMAILPVWKAWSRVHNELRLALKHIRDIQDPSTMLCIKPPRGLSAICKYLSKLLRFSKKQETKNKQKSEKKKSSSKKVETCLIGKNEHIPDELLFIMLPDKVIVDETATNKEMTTEENLEKCFKNKNLKPSTEESAQQAESKLLKEKLYRLSETRSSVKKRRNSSACSQQTPSKRSAAAKEKKKQQKQRNRRSSAFDASSNCIKRRRDLPLRQSLRHQLALRTSAMDQLYDREYALTKQLTSNCKLYKMENDLYTNTEHHLEISIGQIQRNIESYADEIIRTEHELLELKNEIRQDISLINNLKRMTLEPESVNECGVPLRTDDAAAEAETSINAAKQTVDAEKMLFVDNIYEFCDNNASMLV